MRRRLKTIGTFYFWKCDQEWHSLNHHVQNIFKKLKLSGSAQVTVQNAPRNLLIYQSSCIWRSHHKCKNHTYLATKWYQIFPTKSHIFYRTQFRRVIRTGISIIFNKKLKYWKIYWLWLRLWSIKILVLQFYVRIVDYGFPDSCHPSLRMEKYHHFMLLQKTNARNLRGVEVLYRKFWWKILRL